MPSSIQDLLLRSLRLEKETFWLEHQGLPSAETQRLWALRTTDLLSVLGPSAPSEPLDLNDTVPRSITGDAFQYDEAPTADQRQSV